MFVDSNELYFVLALTHSIQVFFRCPEECTACYFPNNCSACIPNYYLQGGQCLQDPSHCVQNKFIAKGICEEYCDRRCKTCNMSRTDCVKCAQFHQMDADGQCVIQSQSLSIFISVRPLLNVLKRRGHRWIFMVVDDLWLYQYHQKEYEGIIR